MEVKFITFRANSEYYQIVLNAPIVGSSHDELRAKAKKRGRTIHVQKLYSWSIQTMFFVNSLF